MARRTDAKYDPMLLFLRAFLRVVEYVLDLGRNLAPLPEQHRTEANKVKGCQSQVWMVAALDPESGRMQIAADSVAPASRMRRVIPTIP